MKIFLYLAVLGKRAKKPILKYMILDGLFILNLRYIGYFKNGLVWICKRFGYWQLKKIKYKDGYKINLIYFEKDKKNKKQLLKKNKVKKYLWFVNIGGYIPTSMQEKHEFGLVTASTKLEAKNIAKSKWLIGCKKKHKDDIASLEMLFYCDDCKIIKKIGNLEIELTPDNNFIEENNYPDWYGYQKIDVI